MFGAAFWQVAGQRSGQQVASWKILGPTRVHSLGALGAGLEAFGHLETAWALLERSWRPLGRSWACLGRS